MSRFNLVTEPWVSVIIDEKGDNQLVSLKELFENAHTYGRIAGDTRTQDFAVLRIILAILQTVFSRFDADGNIYESIKLDDSYKPQGEINDEEAYEDDLYETWVKLWEKGEFSPIVIDYLEKWSGHFYLFDEKYPFMQISADLITEDKISKKNASSVSGKNMNRLISESGNKIALFSPRYDYRNNKEFLTEAEITRWLITFQGYTGLSDKVIFGKEKYKASKGWLFDLGGLYLEGRNLFETLLLNLILVHQESIVEFTHQVPCWEISPEEKINSISTELDVDNLAELYTAWSRAIYIDPETDLTKPFSFEIVKLPDLKHVNHFIEPMTLWQNSKTGENKGHFTPRKHRSNEALWRSFGLVALDSHNSEDYHQPGIIQWINRLESENISSGLWQEYEIRLNSVSMKDDGNATSWVPTDEIYDSLNLKEFMLSEVAENYWPIRINDAVEQTKKVVSFIYKNLIDDICEIRNLSDNSYSQQKVLELYFNIDQPFRNWLSCIQIDDSKDEKLQEWKRRLFQLVTAEADKVVSQASPRDYKGIFIEDKKTDRSKLKNIATAHNRFMYFLRKELNLKEG